MNSTNRPENQKPLPGDRKGFRRFVVRLCRPIPRGDLAPVQPAFVTAFADPFFDGPLVTDRTATADALARGGERAEREPRGESVGRVDRWIPLHGTGTAPVVAAAVGTIRRAAIAVNGGSARLASVRRSLRATGRSRDERRSPGGLEIARDRRSSVRRPGARPAGASARDRSPARRRRRG